MPKALGYIYAPLAPLRPDVSVRIINVGITAVGSIYIALREIMISETIASKYNVA